MATEAIRLLRKQSIESLTSAMPEGYADTAIELWQRLAVQIVALVGESGFASLYARSVYLAQATIPWLTEPAESDPLDRRFASLKANLQAQPPELASQANRLLLVIFTDTLASLIGEPLTERVLNSAWGCLQHAKNNKGELNA